MKSVKVGAKTFKVHPDRYNMTDAFAGKSTSPRHEFFYFNDDGSLVGLAMTSGSSSSPNSAKKA